MIGFTDTGPFVQVVWLADNQISHIAGLSYLTTLSELNLASNLIEVVGSTLVANTALRVLNLADNRLGSFKQVTSVRCPRFDKKAIKPAILKHFCSHHHNKCLEHCDVSAAVLQS